MLRPYLMCTQNFWWWDQEYVWTSCAVILMLVQEVGAHGVRDITGTATAGLWAVVNNAGIFQYPIDAELIPMAQYKKCMAVNFFGAVEVTKVFLPLLRRSKGRLVNVCSLGAEVPIKMMAAYCSTKAALNMFSSVARIELSKWGVKVAIIQPGGFKTNIAGTPDTWDKMEKEILDDISQETRDDYGQDYIHSQKSFLHFVKTKSCPDITPVLWDIQHAISAKNPSSFYTPGKLTYQWICLSSYFPTNVLDYVVQKFLVQDTSQEL